MFDADFNSGTTGFEKNRIPGVMCRSSLDAPGSSLLTLPTSSAAVAHEVSAFLQIESTRYLWSYRNPQNVVQS